MVESLVRPCWVRGEYTMRDGVVVVLYFYTGWFRTEAGEEAV